MLAEPDGVIRPVLEPGEGVAFILGDPITRTH